MEARLTGLTTELWLPIKTVERQNDDRLAVVMMDMYGSSSGECDGGDTFMLPWSQNGRHERAGRAYEEEEAVVVVDYILAMSRAGTYIPYEFIRYGQMIGLLSVLYVPYVPYDSTFRSVDRPLVNSYIRTY